MTEQPDPAHAPRIPVIPTVLVTLAVLVMIALGVWQLQRRAEKAEALALAAANPGRPAVAFPKLPPVEPDILFRPSSVHCLAVESWQVEAGRAADGSTGYRHVAHCSTGAEGPGVLVAVGVGQKPDDRPAWTGGQVEGWISQEPDHRALLTRLGGKAAPLRPMLIARQAPAGLKPVAPPAATDLPNNHLAYAVQWFFFAAIAVIIYILALRRRNTQKSA
ncbi:SURF1 family protein [Sphingobium sp. BYY-5]|uniref:SURF1 family cytochrome oxidase biogenesis protein n=1 Tax=Sphingobium sp. BYY-5 TaxID=2926400 RepID=UPI001FA7D0D9|nr:SURF1 family cytochrome oxidase biogenesis protein [Sphingobium sp. BYY-5]MCI4590537.1 SURF1 family protein [Sphingobium sp. BYY-5]